MTSTASEGVAPDGTVVVVGASLAGSRAAKSLRDQGFAGKIVVVGAEPHAPYDRPPLSKQVLVGTWGPERIGLLAPDALDALALDLRLGVRATALDADARTVVLEDGSTLRADAVVVATGTMPRKLPGTEDVEGVFVLRTLEDCAAIRERVLAAGAGCRVVVVGAGFIGSEVASSCAELGATVTVLEALETPLEGALGAELGAACAGLHEEGGVELRTGVGVSSVRAGAEGLVVELTDGRALRADVVVVGIGVMPVVDWLGDSGLTLDNGVVCDAKLFAADGVVAAGDVARWEWRRDGRSDLVRIEHWQVAADGGAAAGTAVLAGRRDAPDFAPVPYFWSDQYGVKIQMLGHPSRDDEVIVVDGTLASRRFVALYARAGRLTGVLGISRPRQVMAHRRLLAQGASLDEARALASA
jgi:3-phenylpropionate/trans-cinnamate dioxygenase ferredoxin reductase component